MQRMIADRSRPGRRAERTERMPGRLVWPGVGRWSRLWHLTWENLASWSPIALQRLKIAYGRTHTGPQPPYSYLCSEIGT